jgi:hypothetical protein
MRSIRWRLKPVTRQIAQIHLQMANCYELMLSEPLRPLRTLRYDEKLGGAGEQPPQP